MPSGKQIVSASMDGSLKLWDLAGNCLQTFTGHTSVVRQLPAKSQSLRLQSHEAEIICLPSGLKFALRTQSVCPVKVCANFSPDGKQIASASRKICIWQLSPQSQPSWQLQHLWGNGYRSIWAEICTPNPTRMSSKSLQTVTC
jgi:WD40 repeat protein